MIKYSDQTFQPSEVHSTEKFDDLGQPIKNLHAENGISLAKLWEYAIRTNSLPDDLELPQIFSLIQEKLRNPEWEVRQHALRVLSDIIPLVNLDTIDENMEMLLGDLVTNLGHIAPAVRKGAVDSLRIYLKHSKKSDNFLRNLIERGVKMPQENNVHPNIVAGIILSVPFLVVPKMNEDTIFYAVQSLLDETTKISRRDIALRSLFRIKELIGTGKFNQYLNGYKNEEVRRDFDYLYDTHYNLLKSNLNREIDTFWGDFSQNSDEKECVVKIPDDGKVILETEIQLNSGSAIRMQIHEESRQSSVAETDSDEESRNGIGIIKILSDESEKEDYATQRRTPRRVHFGGEVVKMRTPDSDSNNTSEENTATKRAITKKITLKHSLIPIPIKVTTMNKTKNKMKKRTNSTSINIKETHIFGNPINCTSSRIPTKKGHSLKNTTRVRPEIKINSPSKELPEKPPIDNKGDGETHKTNLSVPSIKNTPKGDRFSPIPVHHEIELLHNLMRSPSRSAERPKVEENRLEQTKQVVEDNKNDENKIGGIGMNGQNTTKVDVNEENKTLKGNFEDNTPLIGKSGENKPQRMDNFEENSPLSNKTVENKTTRDKTVENERPPIDTSEDKRISTADDALLSFKPIRTGQQRRIQTADEVFVSPRPKIDAPKTTYDSFRVCDLKPPPNPDRVQSPNFNGCHEGIIYDLNCKGHLRTRLHGLEYFLQQVTAHPSILEVIEERLPFVINALFSSTQQALLKNMAEKSLFFLFEHLKKEVLLNRLNQISIALSKLGEPDGVRLSIVLMRRITPVQLTKQLISESILGAKSSKIREGALQIIMAVSILYPSTDINITETARSVLRVLRDRKKRVRQAALETLASLAQASSTDTIMGIARKIFNCTQDGKLLLALLRTRLSKKQLPSVGVSGSIIYSESTDDFYRSRDESDFGKTHHYNSEGNISRLGGQNRTSYWNQEHDKINNNWIRDSGQHYFRNDRKMGREWKKSQDKSDSSDPNPPKSPWIRSKSTLSSNNEEILPRIHPKNSRYAAQNSSSSRINYENSLPPPTRISSLNSLDSSFSKNTFTKSFSTDNIKFSDSASSGCSSSISTGYYTRFGQHQVDHRSGIPIPKFQPRQKCQNTNSASTSRIHRSKLSTPKDSPVKSAHSILTRQPFSSGSESSGYFTPPAEPLIIEDTNKHQSKDFCGEPPKHLYEDQQKEPYLDLQDDPQPYENSQNESFITLDPTNEEDPIEITPTKTSLPNTPLKLPKIEPLPTNVRSPRSTFSSLENLDLETPSIYRDKYTHSKSEVDLTSKTKITRKTVYSAPITNNESSNKSCPDFCEEFHTEIILPGAIVDVNETIQIKETKQLEETEEIQPCSKQMTKYGKTPDECDGVPPFPKPKDGFNETISQLESIDWETTMKGLQNLVRLIRHHQQLVEAQIHTICVLLGKHIKNLRSQVARQACTVASEMFVRLKKTLEIELEELATPLLHRTADTNKFLRSDANSALDSMCLYISPPKVVSVVTTKGSCHQNALVRSTSVRLLCGLTHRLGHERIFQLPKETRDKILLTGANMLMEGSLETRKHAKMLLGHLAKHCQFHKAITDAVPARTLRHIEKTLKSLK